MAYINIACACVCVWARHLSLTWLQQADQLRKTFLVKLGHANDFIKAVKMSYDVNQKSKATATGRNTIYIFLGEASLTPFFGEISSVYLSGFYPDGLFISKTLHKCISQKPKVQKIDS